MAKPDLAIHAASTPHPAQHQNLSVREDVAFSDAKGKPNDGVRKKALKALEHLAEPLSKTLAADESVLYVLRANAPMGYLERYSFGAYAAVVTLSVLVVTNKRLLQFRTKSRGAWTRSWQQVAWSDVRSATLKGLLAATLTLEYRNGRKDVFWGIPRADKNALEVILPTVLKESATEAVAAGEMRPACPECRALLTPVVYECGQCGLVFKNEKAMRWRVLIPSAAYFYTGHPWLAVLDGIGELFAVLMILAGIAGVLTNDAEAAGYLIVGLVVFAIDAAIAYAHNRRFVREFLPTKEHKSKFAVSASAGS